MPALFWPITYICNVV